MKVEIVTLKLKSDISMFQASRTLTLSFVASKWFTIFINIVIIVNTACLSLDSYPINQPLMDEIEKLNLYFLLIFSVEMAIKVYGMGPKTYIRDFYNILDSTIVILSIVDVSITGYPPKPGKDPLSSFRFFRLLRIFKLARSWDKL